MSPESRTELINAIPDDSRIIFEQLAHGAANNVDVTLTPDDCRKLSTLILSTLVLAQRLDAWMDKVSNDTDA